MAQSGSAESSKILVVRVGRGGDMVMITPALDALLKAFPATEFHLMTTRDGRRTLAGFDDRLTEFLIYDRRFPRSVTLKRELGRTISRTGYDRIYCFETKPLYRNWLSRMTPEFHGLEANPTSAHFSDRCLDVVQRSVDDPVSRGWLRLPVRDEGIQAARELLEAHGVAPGTRLVGLHPTFSGAGLPIFRGRGESRHRMWPAESFAELAVALKKRASEERLKLAVVVDCLPAERKLIDPVAELSGGAMTVLSAPPDFQRYKGLLSLLDVLVVANTGPMHMAAALNVNLVALFSRWLPEDCGPFMDPAKYRVLRAEETTRPELGLTAIEPDVVLEAAMGFLKD